MLTIRRESGQIIAITNKKGFGGNLVHKLALEYTGFVLLWSRSLRTKLRTQVSELRNRAYLNSIDTNLFNFELSTSDTTWTTVHLKASFKVIFTRVVKFLHCQSYDLY